MEKLFRKVTPVLLLCAACTMASPVEEKDLDLFAVTTDGHMDHTHMHDSSTHDHDHDHGSGDDGGHSMMMQMYFYSSAHATILFEGWHTMTAGELFGSCLAVMVMAFLYEGFKAFRQGLLTKALNKASMNQVQTFNSNTETVGVGSTDKIVPDRESAAMQSPPPSMTQVLMSSPHIIQSLLHFLQLFFSYCLMLIFMTYNIYLCLFLCIGGAFGYWFFMWNSSSIVDKNEHCN